MSRRPRTGLPPRLKKSARASGRALAFMLAGAALGLNLAPSRVAAQPALSAGTEGTVAAKDGAGEASGAASQPRMSIAFLPTLIVDGEARRLPGQREPELLVLASGLDALLSDTAQDLGLTVELTYRTPPRVERLSESDLVAQAKAIRGVLLSPSIEILPGGDIEIRLVLADARSRALRVRVERVAREDLEVRTVVMLRDLVTELAGFAGARPTPATPLGGALPAGVLATPASSAGRATLAVNATLFGGLVGFSIHRSSGSDDPRLLYPLLAVGAGIGLGGAIIVAEEWDVGVGDGWYLVSGAWWPTLAGHLIYEGRFSDLARNSSFRGERWASGLVGGAAGVTLATLGLALHGMSEGGALLAHSGGGLGVVLGGLAELSVRGDIYRAPFAGMGYGAGLGWLAAAAAATQIRASTSRVLAVDLGAIVGGLGGAALGSPLLFGEPTAGQQRAWLGATAGGSLIGVGVALYMTRERRPEPSKVTSPPRSAAAARPRRVRPSVGLPMPGIVGESAVGSRRAPVLGVSWQGMLP